MRFVLYCVLASSLLTHAVFGCCWHAAHENSACGETPAALSAIGDCDHEYDAVTEGAGPKGHDSHGPCKGHSHCHGMCNYLPGQKSQSGKCLVSVPLDFTWVGAELSVGQVRSVSFVENAATLTSGPPLRLHLLHQIILI